MADRHTVRETAPKRLQHVLFGVLSSDQIVALSEVECTQRDFYHFTPITGNAGQVTSKKAVNGSAVKPPAASTSAATEREPKPGGVLDRRLGIADKKSNCETCGERAKECVGHYGYIKLTVPLFHTGYFRKTIEILQVICKVCSRTLLDDDQQRAALRKLRRPNLDNTQRDRFLKEVVATAKKALNCPHCGSINGTVKKAGSLKIIHEKYRARKMKPAREAFEQSFDHALQDTKELKGSISRAQDDLNPLRALKLFECITNPDCELLGLDATISRPETFIWQYLLVPPVTIRPSVQQDDATNEDDLTVKLAEIVFTNQLIKSGLAKGIQTNVFMEQWDFLQHAVATYINSDVNNNTISGQKPMRGLCQRLKGKQGRFRGNLSGKRVDFSARTVISPDPNLRIDEVAVPEKVAKILTYPERVTSHNLEQLRKAVRNGKEVHPGACYVISAATGIKKDLKYGNPIELAKQLRIGDVVERHLRDDDIVLFNRQPSLHKLSIMSHRVKVRPWRTFRLNECVCTPYNADFDGDEMNLHVPQTEEARTEAAHLMSIKQNLVTPRNGEPIIAATQDFITGAFLLSRRDKFLNRAEIGQILCYLTDAEGDLELPPPTILRPKQLWTGKQVFSVLMRPSSRSSICVNLEAKCRTFEAPPAGYAPDMSPNDGYLVIENSVIMCGALDKATVGDGKKNSVFGVLLRDYGADAAAQAMNRLSKLCARWLTNQGFSIGISDVTPGDKLRDEKDDRIRKAYEESNLLITQAAHGKLENAAGCDQDQTLEASISGVLSRVRDKVGEICMTELSRNNAPLIMAICGSKGSKINVCQMVACVGQQITNGKRVADGFINRSLPHYLKKSKNPPSKGFVRNSFYSGLTATEFFFHAISGREGLVDTAVKTAETGYMQRRLMKALEDLSTRYDLSVRSSTGSIVQFMYGNDGLDPAYMEGDGSPVEFVRTWQHIRATVPHTKTSKPLMPYAILELTDRLLATDRFDMTRHSDFPAQIKAFVVKHIVAPAARFRRAYGMIEALEKHEEWDDETDLTGLAGPKAVHVVDQKTKTTEDQIARFLLLCWEKYARSMVEPGTAVGAIGAQSIGEPGTQMTLKTFHFAGVASMNVTLGVPRIKEIINASKVISTPIITAELLSDLAQSEASARVIKARIEKTYLGEIASQMAPTVTATQAYVNIQIDMDTVSRLQLEVTPHSIAASILAAKLKLGKGNVSASHSGRIRIYLPDDDGSESTSSAPHKLDRLNTLCRLLPNVVVKGVGACSRAVIQVKQGSSKEKHLLVEGNGLREVMTTDGVDGRRVTSNHIMEVVKVLGIEAARQTIINEIGGTMGAHGLSVDPRHLGLLGDVMTCKGEVLGITRFGVAKLKDSTLMLASFEKTTDHLFDAAVYSRQDDIDGISESIIMGLPANNCGTSLPSVVSKRPVIRHINTPLFERLAT
ncbi:uncharacterized protein L969DRAFT_86320 [Mixia osmundae IAM 14324]|uniref:DNA-directed RNA polymerase subunit n=1 Tax=Mixia osmundae (strain CBS 9802 / IAM 14324 / JCM 22182 / KY 12970) TaxID=764103 RepID=G7DUE3_MIXOS|nr:uncharacterized protein L969DRAFT_86320 [Mixia osmundae IAM 14324]KEI41075.1 hypothetical protein L969DRAFT_86320 [Mixia osmundae IAM 14324]GAA94203.1 hypothetical protein E5Q_00851 [Mixia osmundae IAM 14324]